MSTFPSGMPEDIDNAASISVHDWQAFRQLAIMENHWQRPGWLSGRRSYHWMLSFHDADEVQRLAKQCQAQLPSVGLDLVPLDALHITIGRIGFTDELAATTIDAVVSTAIPRCQGLSSLALTIGPVAGSKGAIRFSIAPWSPLLALHRELSVATRAVIGDRCVMNTAEFRPHLSIAYANTTVPVESLLSTLERLRSLPPASARVREVGLVELRREGRAYRYDVMAKVPFANA